MTTDAGVAHQSWSSRRNFVLAMIGLSVGLGNIWRFPYLASESGGGVFVLIYIACVLVLAIPILMAEMAIGRRGGLSPPGSFRRIALAEGKSPRWSIAGIIAVITAFLILSYYAVIGGWTLDFLVAGAVGAFGHGDIAHTDGLFSALLADPWLLIFWTTVFFVFTAGIVAGGVQGGIERAARYLMPLLFVLLVATAIYALFAGDAAAGLAFLFAPDWSEVTWGVFLDALGQAFFSVTVGGGAALIYGAYVPRQVSLPRAATTIALADTAVALIAGIAIFPFVLAFDLTPTESAGLVFVTLPAAFANLGNAALVAVPFFLLLAVAAVMTCVGLLEVLVAWGMERGWSRPKTAIGAAFVCWLVGLLTVFSFNIAAGLNPLSFVPTFETATMFDIADRMTATIGLPIGGLLIAIFVGHVMSAQSIADELGWNAESGLFKTWRFIMRWPAPIIIAAVLVVGVLG